MSDSEIIGLVVAGVVVLGAGVYCLERMRRRQALRQWAADNDYTLVDFEQPMWTEDSPFTFTVSKAQQVYYVSVKLKDGRNKSGWLLLGSGWFGSACEEADIRWDN